MTRQKSALEMIIKAASSFGKHPSAPTLAKSGYAQPRIHTFTQHSDINFGLGITHSVPQPYHAPRSNRPYKRPYVRR